MQPSTAPVISAPIDCSGHHLSNTSHLLLHQSSSVLAGLSSSMERMTVDGPARRQHLLPPSPASQADHMSAYWATTSRTPSSVGRSPPQDRSHSPRPQCSMQDVGQHFRLQAPPPQSRSQHPDSHASEKRRRRRSLKLRGFQGFLKSRREDAESGIHANASGIPTIEASLIPGPLRPAALRPQRSVSQPPPEQYDEDYPFYYDLAGSPGFPDPSFSNALASYSGRVYPKSADSSPPGTAADWRTRKESVTLEPADFSLFVAATTGFNPMSPDPQEGGPPARLPPTPASPPMHLSPLHPASRQPPQHTEHPESPPYGSREEERQLHPSQLAYLQQPHLHIETPQMRAAAHRASSQQSPTGLTTGSLEDIEGDDELPDYATSQREAQEHNRREAARRAQELEARWASSRMGW